MKTLRILMLADLLLTIVFYGWPGIMIFLPSAYGLFYFLSFLIKKWQPIREDYKLQFWLIVVSACVATVAFIMYLLDGVSIDFVYTSGDTWNFGDAMALLAFYGLGTLFCMPLFMNAIGFLKNLPKKEGLSRLKKVFIGLAMLIYMAMVGYFAVRAVIASVIALLIIIAVIFVGWICLHLIWDTVSNPFGHGGGSGGSGGSSSGGGVEYRCGSCGNYSGGKCNLNPGAMVSPNDSCSNFRF